MDFFFFSLAVFVWGLAFLFGFWGEGGWAGEDRGYNKPGIQSVIPAEGSFSREEGRKIPR